MADFRKGILVTAVSVPMIVACVARAQEYPEPYDGLKASEDAHRYADARRRDAIKQQLNTIEWMRWWSGDPAAPKPDTMYYRDPPSLDYVYGTGRSTRPDTYGRPNFHHVPGVFEPWPTVPGDIYGYRYSAPARQPIGRREVQTGPHRWESHPIYADEPEPTPIVRPAPAPKRKLEGPRSF